MIRVAAVEKPLRAGGPPNHGHRSRRASSAEYRHTSCRRPRDRRYRRPPPRHPRRQRRLPGAKVTVFNDPIVAKLVWGRDRARRSRPSPLAREFVVKGIQTRSVPPEASEPHPSSSKGSTTPASSSSTWRAAGREARRCRRCRGAARRGSVAAIAPTTDNSGPAAAPSARPHGGDPWKTFGRAAVASGLCVTTWCREKGRDQTVVLSELGYNH